MPGQKRSRGNDIWQRYLRRFEGKPREKINEIKKTHASMKNKEKTKKNQEKSRIQKSSKNQE